MTAQALVADLSAALGPAHVLTAPEDVAPYAIDWRRLFPGAPACVVRPADAGEVAAVLRVAAAHGASVVPQGGNTGMAGGAAPDASGRQILLSLARMNRIRALDPVGMTIAAEAGVILQVAKEAAVAAGRMLPVSLAAEGSAMIGGIVSTNAGGVNVLRYGMARALVLGLEVVLADGTVIDGMRRLRKDNAGYDLKQLFIGSEGTLGIVTAAVLRLVPLPRHGATALLAVQSPAAALEVFARAQTELGDTLSAFELMSGAAIALVERHCGLAAPLAPAPWFLLVEAASTLPGLREAAETLLGALFEEGLAQDGVVAESGAQAAGLWRLREHITEAEARRGRSVKHDISVPLTDIPAFLDAAGAALAALAPDLGLNVFGHVGDGNLHYNVLTGAGHDAHAINHAVHDCVAAFGGSISAEHGIGQYRVAELRRLRAPAEQALSARLKAALDPEGRLNPGKVLASPGA